MKKLFYIATLSIATFVNAQQLPDNLKLAVKENSIETEQVKLKPDLSYYSKNYNKIFGHDNYTFDVFDYGARNIYVGDINRWYYDNNTPHIFKVMPLAGVNVDASMAQPNMAGYTLKN